MYCYGKAQQNGITAFSPRSQPLELLAYRIIADLKRRIIQKGAHHITRSLVEIREEHVCISQVPASLWSTICHAPSYWSLAIHSAARLIYGSATSVPLMDQETCKICYCLQWLPSLTCVYCSICESGIALSFFSKFNADANVTAWKCVLTR